MNIPSPTITRDGCVTYLGWPDLPYRVEISAYDTVYLKVKEKRGYRPVNTGNRGYIASTTKPRQIEKITKRYLKIAWKRNQNPKFAKDTRTMVDLTVAQYGS